MSGIKVTMQDMREYLKTQGVTVAMYFQQAIKDARDKLYKETEAWKEQEEVKKLDVLADVAAGGTLPPPLDIAVAEIYDLENMNQPIVPVYLPETDDVEKTKTSASNNISQSNIPPDEIENVPMDERPVYVSDKPPKPAKKKGKAKKGE